jgi:hypothetical protein
MKAQQEMLKDPEKVKELEQKMQARLKEGEEMLAKAKEAEARIKAKEGKDGDKDGEETDKKEGVDDDEKKPAVASNTDEEYDMPDIPNLNLN